MKTKKKKKKSTSHICIGILTKWIQKKGELILMLIL